EVILAWQGLGYNRRAVALHEAAKAVDARGWPEDLTELPGVGPYTAAAIRNQAFDEPVLPVDTNVARIQKRTGQAFGPGSLQALFDLGATICLARIPRCEACPLAAACPSRGRRYDPLRKQAPFEGSFRQRRADTLRLVAGEPRRLVDLDSEAVAALAKDGLVEEHEGLVRLPG
nr:A/G-specific adenine glycosylase [Actinomycetota bacterium]